VRLCRESDVDLVIGLGGGSVMDAAKVIAAGVPYAGDPWDFAPHRQKTCPPPTTSLPTIMVPTLAATASEMNDVAVLTNTDTREKTGIHHKCFYPRVSIMDPELTRSVPQKPTAYGAVDIFSHTAETYLSGKGDTPLQDGMQETIMRIALEMGAIAVADGNDLSARTHLQWASILSHNGWTRLGTGGLFPMHKIEHAVSAYTDLAHGAGLAILMPAYMRVACRTHPEKYVRLAEKVLGIETAGRDPVASALDGIAKLESVIQSMGAPIRLSEVGIGEDLFDCILDHILRLSAGPDGSLPGAPPMDRTALLDVLRTAK